MRFLVDDCLSPTFVTMLAQSGHSDSVHPMHIGLFGVRDDTILNRAIADDRIVITANARHYRRLLTATPIHPGVIIVEPLTRTRTWQLVRAALSFVELQPKSEDYMINRVIEVTLAGGVTAYELSDGSL